MNDEPKICPGCGKTLLQSQNYCDWQCTIAAARKSGGEEHLPNGLPIRCITFDNRMLEHEHGDHPTYMFPVDVAYSGDPEDVTERDDDGKVWYDGTKESHALIYTDGCIAVTIYECCYSIWSLTKSGRKITGDPLWEKGKWALTQESIEKILGLTISNSQT